MRLLFLVKTIALSFLIPGSGFSFYQEMRKKSRKNLNLRNKIGGNGAVGPNGSMNLSNWSSSKIFPNPQ